MICRPANGYSGRVDASLELEPSVKQAEQVSSRISSPITTEETSISLPEKTIHPVSSSLQCSSPKTTQTKTMGYVNPHSSKNPCLTDVEEYDEDENKEKIEPLSFFIVDPSPRLK
ncbi:hypothetical protein ACTXT7_007045 [Hymenolepis weldensis]